VHPATPSTPSYTPSTPGTGTPPVITPPAPTWTPANPGQPLIGSPPGGTMPVTPVVTPAAVPVR
jgi:hypothetical protein